MKYDPTKSFAAAMEFSLRWEGGYADHPADPGGETYRGISRRHHPTWPGWGFVDAQPRPIPRNRVFPELEPQVRGFYREHYWDRIKGDQLPPRLAATVLDWAIHSGVLTASRELQRMVSATPDGSIGPVTLAAVWDWLDRAGAESLTEVRRDFLTRLIARRPSLGVFRSGWVARLENLSSEILRG